MGLFTRILEKLGIDRKDDDAFGTRPYEKAPGKPATPGPHSGSGSGGGGGRGGSFGNVVSSTTQAAGAAVRPVSEVDVVAKLEQKAAGKDLNWKTSIVDLLKLLDLDSSLPARRELADELGASADLKDGSAEMNTWLHREVLRRIAANGGNIPRNLLLD
jgi:hypothetical protein